MSDGLRVVHYLNQFFAQIGGEEKAGAAPQVKDGFLGPGRAAQEILKGRGNIVATIICGDNYFAENMEMALNELLKLIKSYRPDILIAGPAFNSGRYGVACGALCKAVQSELGIPSVTGAYQENPGVDLYRKEVYIIQTTESAQGMVQGLTSMINLACKLAAREKTGRPSDEGYFSHGIMKNEFSSSTAAERAVDMLTAKLSGEPFETEVNLPRFDRINPAPPVKDISSAKIGLITDGGLVPKGNPDKMPNGRSTRFAEYSIQGIDDLTTQAWEAVHHGYDTHLVNEDPDRLVPVDVLRDLEKEHAIGKLHEKFYTTAGVATSLENSRKIGLGIAHKLLSEGVSAAILTST